MDHKEKLTNERLKGKFINQFDLVNYAIRLAENMVRSGRGPRIKSETQNPAVVILEEIAIGKDHFDDIGTKEYVQEEIQHIAIPMKDFEKKKSFKEKESEKKKNKKRVELDDDE